MKNHASHISQCLKRVYGLIENESSWTRLAHARRSNGRPTTWWDYTATQFSLYGALRRCNNQPGEFEDTAHLIQESIVQNYPNNIIKYNDIIGFNENGAITHKDIILVLNAALNVLRREITLESIIITKTMRKSWAEHVDEVSILDLEHLYYLGYLAGKTEKIKWEDL